MNRGGKKARLVLPPCPLCGMDSGERMQSTTAPFRCYVVCGTCGASTFGYKVQGGATKAWQRGEVRK